MNKGCDLPNTIEFLELLRWKFELDYDSSLIITPPEFETDNEKVLYILNQCLPDIQEEIVARSKLLLRQCVGGPLNGRPHGKSQYCYYGIFHHVSRGKWASYAIQDDERAFFVGYVSNEKKARALAFSRSTAAYARIGRGEEKP